jgi:hypothetical protein
VEAAVISSLWEMSRRRLPAAILALACLVCPWRSARADSLQDILGRTSNNVSSFLDVFSSVNCSERVLQERLDDNGKTVEKHETAFDYLVLLSNSGGELNLEESRVAANNSKALPKDASPLLISNGFSMLLLIFHPYYAASFHFSLAAEASPDPALVAVRFETLPGGRTPAALSVRGREYPLPLSGTAWIDPHTGVIHKIEARIGMDMEDIGLRAMRSEVEYAPVSFQSSPGTYWLPARASVDVKSRHQHWRNTHLFTAYKRFSVSTQEQTSQP